MDLHAAIMNLACKVPFPLKEEPEEARAYQKGHKDARHAAAELAASHAAEVEALRADAERYRWLRDNPWPPEMEADILLHRNARWDAAIDAARAALKGD
jgi:hypothetical protein